MMTAAELAHALGGRKSGAGWMASCPGHDDQNPSLSITDAEDGKMLLHDFGGCSQERVIETLRAKGLWHSRPTHATKQYSRIIATYDYTDEQGRLLYQVCRTEPKNFLQRYPDGADDWVWRKHPRQVLYRLPEVIEAAIVFVVEGEKDCESLRAHGLVATTNAGGAEAPWLSIFTETLRGREVILIPDADGPGRQRVLRIAQSLLGHAASVVVFAPDGAKDISEWFDRGHSEVELIEQLQRGVAAK
jgi:hypothetical protein